MATLPALYRFLQTEPGPRILLEALKVYGVAETPGPNSNPSILKWAKATGLAAQYTDDATPWCGLVMAYVALQAGYEPPLNPLWARNWQNFGTAQEVAMLGDVLVFQRGKSGHVGLYVGEDGDCYHVLGGNQSDMVMIKRIAKSRLLAIRRCPWRINQPGNVRVVKIAAQGVISANEA